MFKTARREVFLKTGRVRRIPHRVDRSFKESTWMQIASGESPVTIKYRPFGRKAVKTGKLSIKSRIFNVEHPDLRLVRHCNNSQLLWTVQQLRPQKVLWFHNNPRILNDICTQVSQETGVPSFPVKTRPLTLQP